METILWKNSLKEDVRNQVSCEDPTGKQLRAKAFERAADYVLAASETRAIQSATIVIDEGKTMEMPLVQAQIGISSLKIILKPHAKLNFSFLQNIKSNESSFTYLEFELEEGAELECTTGTFGAKESTLIIETNVTGSGAQVRQKNIFFGADDQKFEIYSTTNMRGTNSQANISAHGALQDNSHGRFDGGIVIEQTGHGCDGQLIEKALLLSNTCKIDAIPRLKIETNDVTAGHSASMTRVDEEQLFYAASRGIPEEDAVFMIASGFMSAAYENTPFAKIAEQITSKKLRRI